MEKRVLDFAINDVFDQGAVRWNMHYRQQLSDNLLRRVAARVGTQCEAAHPGHLQEALKPSTEAAEVLVVQMDGSMVPIRGEEPWKEVKVGVTYRHDPSTKKPVAGSARTLPSSAPWRTLRLSFRRRSSPSLSDCRRAQPLRRRAPRPSGHRAAGTSPTGSSPPVPLRPSGREGPGACCSSVLKLSCTRRGSHPPPFRRRSPSSRRRAFASPSRPRARPARWSAGWRCRRTSTCPPRCPPASPRRSRRSRPRRR